MSQDDPTSAQAEGWAERIPRSSAREPVGEHRLFAAAVPP